MKKILKIFEWTFIILVVFIAGIAAMVASRQNLTYNAIYPGILASKYR